MNPPTLSSTALSLRFHHARSSLARPIPLLFKMRPHMRTPLLRSHGLNPHLLMLPAYHAPSSFLISLHRDVLLKHKSTGQARPRRTIPISFKRLRETRDGEKAAMLAGHCLVERDVARFFSGGKMVCPCAWAEARIYVEAVLEAGRKRGVGFS
jgi:hypothetical protein